MWENKTKNCFTIFYSFLQDIFDATDIEVISVEFYYVGFDNFKYQVNVSKNNCRFKASMALTKKMCTQLSPTSKTNNIPLIA